MGADKFSNFFDGKEEVTAYVESEIEHMQSFYRSIQVKPQFKFQVIRKPLFTEEGLMIQVFMPEQKDFKTKANMFCVYRIEKVPEDQESSKIVYRSDMSQEEFLEFLKQSWPQIFDMIKNEDHV